MSLKTIINNSVQWFIFIYVTRNSQKKIFHIVFSIKMKMKTLRIKKVYVKNQKES